MLKLKELKENIKVLIEDSGELNINKILEHIHYDYNYTHYNDISNIYRVYAENTTPVLYSNLLKALKETNVEDYMREALFSIDYQNYDLYEHIQEAYYLMLRKELEEKDIYIKEYYILNKLIEEHDIINIDNIVYDDLVSIEDLSMIEEISQLDEIVEEIVEEVK